MRQILRRAVVRQSITIPTGTRSITHKRVHLSNEDSAKDVSGVDFATWADDHGSELAQSSTIRRSFSGIQPTGVPHLGNYLGALRQWKQLHDQASNPKFAMDHQYEQYFSVVDLHALTSDIPGPERARLRKESYAALLAIGLKNNSHTTLFFQSEVSVYPCTSGCR